MTESEMKDYCFLFLFPSDYEFEKEMLVDMCMDFNFLGEIDGWFDLLWRSYLLFSRRDILRGRILYKVNYDKIRSLMDGKQYVLEDEVHYAWLEDRDVLGKSLGISESWHISLVCSNINQTTFETLKVYGSKLKTLLFIRDYGSSLTRIPPDLFLIHECITTLDLSGSHITELPTSIGNARLMRYLDLSFTLLESLPESIVQLSQLQILKLQGCKYLYELPRGTKRLIHLRHLDFDVLGQLNFLPEGMGALTNLQTLSAFVINSEEGSNIRELKNMNKLSGRFCISGLENVSCVDIHEADLQNKTHLTHLQLRWNDRKLYSDDEQINARNIIANVNLSYNLKELNITCYPGLELPAWIDFRLHRNLASITLYKCENTELSLPLGQLPNLKYLSIVHMNRVAKIDGRILRDRMQHIVGFSSLEKLEIDSLSSIQTWTDVSHEDFPRLSEFVIKQCPMLIDLPFLPYLHSLRHLEISRCTEFECLPDGALSTSLETLIIDDCPMLKERCTKKGEDWHKIKHVPSIWIDLEDICSIHDDAVEDDNLTAEKFTVSQKKVAAIRRTRLTANTLNSGDL
ncbi:unnamed protein product [Amaranthus hypochondriacus]